MRFDYYDSLSPRNQAIYRASDRVTGVDVGDSARFVGPVAAVREALEKDSPRKTRTAVARLCDGLMDTLGIEPVTARVLARRPERYGGELHGLYERAEGERARVTVWMRTGAHERVVAFRTFLRTLLHELCHHLDYELLELADSFHTEGFFKRESSLMNALAPRESAVPERSAQKAAKKAPPEPAQLSLNLGGND